MRRLLLALVAAVAVAGMVAGPATAQEYPPPEEDGTEVVPDDEGEVEDDGAADGAQDDAGDDAEDDGQAGGLPETGDDVLVLAGLGLGLGAMGAGGLTYARRRSRAEAGA